MIPDIALKLAPEFVEWNSPLSVDTQTSPDVLGLTAILTGEVEEARLPAVVENVLPPSADTKNFEPEAA